jgi:hypothetical protein
MKSKGIYLVFWLVLLFLVPAAAGAEDVLAGFTLTSINGETLQGADLAGKPVVITVMAHW